MDRWDYVSLHVLRPDHGGALAHLHDVGLILYRLVAILYLAGRVLPYPLQTFRVDDVPLNNRINMTTKLCDVFLVPPCTATFILVGIYALDVAVISLVWNDIVAH